MYEKACLAIALTVMISLVVALCCYILIWLLSHRESEPTILTVYLPPKNEHCLCCSYDKTGKQVRMLDISDFSRIYEVDYRADGHIYSREDSYVH